MYIPQRQSNSTQRKFDWRFCSLISRSIDHSLNPFSPLIQRSMSPQFQPYLESIRATYEKWWQLYTLTDAAGKERQAKQAAPTFDFGLMVQTVKKEERREEEKIERFPVLEGIRKYAEQHVLLVGRPGSGKSTALARLMLEEATIASSRLPVLVELRYWQGSIEQLIRDSLMRHEMPAELFEEALGRSLLLFDGVNELPSEEARSQLSAFRRNHRQIPIVFTTRDLSLGGDLGIEKKLEMQPLKPEQMSAFIQAYLSAEQAERMLRQLNDRLREFGQTPLLLWMLCEVMQQSPDSTLPTNLGEIFRVFTEAYEQSSVRKHEVAALKGDVKPLSDRRLWKKALKALAFLMIQGKTPVDPEYVIPRGEAEEELSRIFPNESFPVRDLLDDLLKYHLLQNKGTDQIEFRHQLIQEYYVAEALLERVEQLEPEQLKQEYLNFLKWTESIALMLALLKDKALAVRVVELALSIDLILGARLAGNVQSDFQSQTVGLIKETELPEWLKVKLLGKTGSPLVTSNLIEYLHHQDIHIVQIAAASLGKTDNPIAIQILTERLEILDKQYFSQLEFRDSDQTAKTWTKCVQSLAYLSPQKATQFLKQRLSPGERCFRVITFFTEGAEILMQLAAEEILPQLIHALRQSLSRSQKEEILNLIRVGKRYEKFVPDLIDILRNEENEYIQEQLATLIFEFSSEIVIQTSIWMMSQFREKLREKAAEFIIKNKLQKTQELEDLLARKSDNPDLAFSAAITLAGLGHRIATTFLGDALINHESTNVRIAAARALKGIDSEEVIAYLLQGLQDSNEFVKQEVAFSLAHLSRLEAVPVLVECLSIGFMHVHVNAIRSLAKLKLETPLWEKLENKGFCWQTAAVELVKLGRTQALCSLCETLIDLGDESSGEVFDLLAKFADSTVIDWLLDALKEPSRYVTDQYFLNRVALVLIRLPVDLADQHLPELLRLQQEQKIEQLTWLIPSIQNRCQFYDYEIYQDCLKAQKVDRQTPQNNDRSFTTIYNIDRLGILNTGDTTIQGDQIG
ncbi:HEAT repeat domain-containing protein, partial [Cyanobacteria bacterium FACHB-63]|nr:HEAT repeat domain-containing protein [Cyanobacteria bacterium FACHB-63]